METPSLLPSPGNGPAQANVHCRKLGKKLGQRGPLPAPHVSAGAFDRARSPASLPPRLHVAAACVSTEEAGREDPGAEGLDSAALKSSGWLFQDLKGPNRDSTHTPARMRKSFSKTRCF